MEDYKTNMNKIVWLSNRAFSLDASKETASWLQPMAEALNQTGRVSIVNVSVGKIKKTKYYNFDGIGQWVIPQYNVSSCGLIASLEMCECVSTIIEKEKPDLVHIWGTERFWTSIYRQGYIRNKVILDIQGLLHTIPIFYFGGLSLRERLKTIHPKEVILPWRTLAYKKRVIEKQGKNEVANLKSIPNIAYQSEWTKNHVRYVNPSARLFATKLMLRDAFFVSSPWHYHLNNDSPVLFSFCSSAEPYKGLHVMVKIAEVLKSKYPKIRIRLAGNLSVGGILKDGYSIYLKNLIMRSKLEGNVTFLGPLDANHLVNELQNANACVITSFVETYCLAFAESMIVGCPTVCSFAGAMPELAEHGKEAFFYSPTDYVQAASYVDKIIEDPELAAKLSYNARKRRFIENDKQKVIERQLEIYETIIYS